MDEVIPILEEDLSRRQALQRLGGMMAAAVAVPRGLGSRRSISEGPNSGPRGEGEAGGLTSGSSPLRESGMPRYQHTTTALPDGRVLVAGGMSTQPLSSVEILDAMRGGWLHASPMSRARVLHAATLLRDGRVLVIGGGHGDQVLSSAEIYDPALDAWSPTEPMKHPRVAHAAITLPTGQVLVTGGYYHQPLSSAELFAPINERWTTL